MPPCRQHAERATAAPRPRSSYSSELAVLKSEFRHTVDAKFRERTGNVNAKMRWTEKGYARGVVVRGRHHFLGWPGYANIPFANPSRIPGGQPTFRFLLALLNVGILRFEPASDDDVDLAKRNPRAVLPGVPPTLSAPFCWGPFGRNDMGLGRVRPVTNPLGLPLRRPKTGPKTPKLVLDSDTEDAAMVELESDYE